VSESTRPRVGFIGLGNMGGRMTQRLVGAGIAVLGFDTAPGQAEAMGATAAASAAEVIQNSDYILLSLPDTKVVEKVVLGENGLLANSREGQIIVDLSTAAPSSTQKIHAKFLERGVQYLDAGISGGAAAAGKGTLTIMVGGSGDALAALDFVMEPIATKVVHMGDSGAGHSMKVLNNFLNAVTLSATAEVMIAAKLAGLDLVKVLDVLNSSSGQSFATTSRFPSIITGNYLEGGLTNSMMTKDVALYVQHARELGVPGLNAAGPLATFGLANYLGYADQISNKVVDAIGDSAGGVRLHLPLPTEGTD
jgi:3-hydroxyisobutyrate dehydrogenase